MCLQSTATYPPSPSTDSFRSSNFRTRHSDESELCAQHPTQGYEPVVHKGYAVPINKLEIVRKELTRLEEIGVIQSSRSECYGIQLK